MAETGTSPDTDSPVAIVGIGCRYGNGVNNVRDFWQMLMKGLDCTVPIPPERFDASYFLSPGAKTAGKMYIQNGGYISQDPYMFDRQFFKMPPGKPIILSLLQSNPSSVLYFIQIKLEWPDISSWGQSVQ